MGLPGRLRTAFERGGEMGRRMCDLDWGGTPLGPPAGWPPELADAVATMLASRAQIVLFWGPDHCALYNDAYITIMGSKHPAHLGRPGEEMWAETWTVLRDLLDGVRTSDEAFWAADHPFTLERHGFLEETWFDVSYDPIRTADGSVGGVFCIVSETTGRVHGERRVRTLSALGARLTGAADEQALAAEAGTVLSENRADVPVARLLLDDDPGLPPGVREVIRTGLPGVVRLDELIEPPPAAADDALVLPIGIGTGTVGALVVGVSRFLALDGPYRDFLELAAAQISRAVAHLRAYEQERARAAELAALDQAKTNFFSNVSHEFRTPLTLILGPLEDLLDDPELPADRRERLLPMHRNGLRLLKLVNTVLDFSRLESGRLRAAYRPTDLSDYTTRLVSTFRSAAERAGLALVVEAPPLPGPVHVDREMWEKIVLNLLSNAVKFTRTGQITVRIGAEGGTAVLEVEDTGIGIPAAEQPLLFDRFHRVRGAWSRSHEGTGIGLALVRELAELHHGSVRARSEPGVGSVFTVTVPFGTAHLPAEQIAEATGVVVPEIDARLYIEEAEHWWSSAEPPAPDKPAGDAAAPGRTGRGQILLVDDNADLRDHVARLLRAHWDVTTAADGQAALELAGRRRFDLVLTDVMMPRLDGFGLIAALRADEHTRDVPIVVLSARAGEEASGEGLAAGADDYLVKPFSARDLTARVRANLDLGQARRQTISRLRGLVDAAAAVNTVRTTAEVLDVAAQHVLAMTSARRVLMTAPDGRAEAVAGSASGDRCDAELPLPDTSGATVGQLRVWFGPAGPPEPVVLTQLARLIGLRLENARLYEAEHRIASTLQHSLLPQSLPRVPGALVASRYLPGSSEAEVGGDWYDAIAAPDEQLVLVIGDVVGKGVQAAAVMGQLRNALRAYVLEGFDCGEALTRLNRLVDNLGRRQFATVVCVRFDPRTGRLHYSSAGHPPPVVVHPGETGVFLYSSALGPPIGALSDARYPTRSAELPPGARLLLYTDGLVEDRHVGIDVGLAALTVDAARPTDHVEDLLDALLGRIARRTRRDDIALLALEAAEPRVFALRLPAEPTRLSLLRRRLTEFLTSHGVPEADVFDLTVAVSEAAANAIEHPVTPTEPVIMVEASLDDEAVQVTVRDTGAWRPTSSTGFRGRGLGLIGALTELSVARSETGTAVTLRRPLARI